MKRQWRVKPINIKRAGIRWREPRRIYSTLLNAMASGISEIMAFAHNQCLSMHIMQYIEAFIGGVA